MKYTCLLAFMAVLLACKTSRTIDKRADQWSNFSYPEINFINQAAGTKGWEIYNRIIPNSQEYIKNSIREVVQTLYWSDKDSIPDIRKINYSFEDVDGISAKGGAPPEISIFYSSRWVEQSEAGGGDDKVLFETRGVLLHELTHGFQLEPQGIGEYGTNKTFFAFIEGMADAVRIKNRGFDPYDPQPGGHWLDGYRTTGYFLDWLTKKDPDFLRKFNKSALEVIPWSFNGAIQHVLGRKYTVEGLWKEYQEFISR